MELTKREKEILMCMCKGDSNNEIAQKLKISEYTVRFHTHNMLEKLRLKNRSQLLIYDLDNRNAN